MKIICLSSNRKEWQPCYIQQTWPKRLLYLLQVTLKLLIIDIKYSHFAIEFLTLCLLKTFVHIKAVWIKLEIILIILNAAFNFTRSIFLFIFNLSFCFKYSSTPGISLIGTENNLWSGFSFFRGNTSHIYFMSRLSPPN